MFASFQFEEKATGKSAQAAQGIQRQFGGRLRQRAAVVRVSTLV